MKLCEVYKVVDAVAPKALSDEYCAKFGAYDNSGILVDTGDDITGILFTLDLTNAALEKAKAVGANLIITHHPVIYGKISDSRESDFEPLDSKLIACIKQGISVISMHLNLDVAVGGIDESLMQGVCVSSAGKGSFTKMEQAQVMHEVGYGGYGRVYGVEETTLGALAEYMKKTFATARVEVYGNVDKKVNRAASFCGAGGDETGVKFAVEHGADVMVSSDFKHHVILLAVEKGLGVIALTHYASENYGFEKYYQKIRESIALPCVYHTDEILL